jgi:hypothetical protein
VGRSRLQFILNFFYKSCLLGFELDTSDSDTMLDFLVNDGDFAARRLRVYIRSLYNRFVTDILVRTQLG